MRMLIATHKALVLYEGGRHTILHEGLGIYYGITLQAAGGRYG